MAFQIHALSSEPFQHLFQLSEEELKSHNACRMPVTTKPGFPCRISLEDAAIGEEVILAHYEHLPVGSPYRSSHAIFVRPGVNQAQPSTGEIPKAISLRLISVRAFSRDHMMVNADVVHGSELEPVLNEMLDDTRVDYLHLHNAKPGCYAANVTRI